MGSLFTSYQTLAQKLVPWLAASLVAIALVSPNGSQPAALLLFLVTFPLVFARHREQPKVSRLWILMLVVPLLASIPLFISSGTGEALAAGARYFVAALVMLALTRIKLDPVLLLRSASAAGVLAVALNLHQLGEMRVNWGVGFLDSGYVSVLLLCLALAQFHVDKGKPKWQIFAVLGIVCLIIAVAKTGTRGAWPAMIGVFAMQFVMLNVSRGRKILFAGVGIAVLALMIITVPTVKNRIDLTVYEVKSYYQENNRTSSVGFRLDLWHIALEGFIESPLWGVSFQRRSQIMDNYAKRHPDSASIGNDGRSSAHNEILNALSKRGLLGALAVLLLYLVPMRYFVRFIRYGDVGVVSQLALAGTGLSITMIVCGITEAPLMNVRVGTTYAFMLVFLYHLVTSLHADYRSSSAGAQKRQ
ncbi:MAG: O-antigen ligase family protein [bacterium]